MTYHIFYIVVLILDQIFVTWMLFYFWFQGSAEVVYLRRSDAFAALKRYNNVLLDGKPMKIEIVGANAEVPISARVNVTGINGRRKRAVVLTYVIPYSSLFFYMFYFIDKFFTSTFEFISSQIFVTLFKL